MAFFIMCQYSQAWLLPVVLAVPRSKSTQRRAIPHAMHLLRALPAT